MTLPEMWIPLRYHPAHAEMWRTDKRFLAAVAGRGSGKTELARRKIVLSLAIKKPWPDPIYAYCLPTYNQAKKVAWKPIIRLLPPNWIKKNGVNVSDMAIETVFGSTLYVVGMDKPHRVEGLQLDGVVLDESSDQRPGVFEKTIIPMLTHRRGWCWRIGVPKRAGIGRIEFKNFFERGLKGDKDIVSFHWKSSEILTPEQLEAERAQLDQQDFDEQFNAQWLDVGGTIYHAFTMDNVSEDAKYDPGLPIYVGCDFNVDPMCWILSHKHGDTIHVFDEIFKRNTSTEATLNLLKDSYIEHHMGWKYYGDAAGRARKTNAVRTDYIILKTQSGGRVFFPERNPAIRDRFACVNAALCNAKGIRRLLINPKCRRLITDLTMMSYKERTTEPENYSGTDYGHMSDALGYLVFRVLPMRVGQTMAPVILTTR